MPAGIRILNDYGTVVIDENYSNICVRASGNTGVDYNGVMNPGVDTSWVAQHPMLVVGGNHTYHSASVYINANGTAHAYSSSETAAPGSFPSYYIPYWIFDVCGPAASYGLVVYKADGSVAFDATQKYARVVDVLAGASYDQGNGMRTYPAGRTYGIAILKPGGKHWLHTVVTENPDGTSGFGTQNEYWRTTFQLNGNTLTVGNEYFVDTPDPHGGKGVNRWDYSLNWAVAVLDMTNY